MFCSLRLLYAERGRWGKRKSSLLVFAVAPFLEHPVNQKLSGRFTKYREKSGLNESLLEDDDSGVSSPDLRSETSSDWNSAAKEGYTQSAPERDIKYHFNFHLTSFCPLRPALSRD